MKNASKILIIAIACTIIAIGLYVYSGFVLPALRETRINSLILQFEQEPSREIAEELTPFLNDAIATTEQGNRILQTLFTPHVVVRTAYPVNIDPYYALKLKVPFTLQGGFHHNRTIYIGTSRRSGRSSGRKGKVSFDAEPEIESMGKRPSSPGSYEVSVQESFEFTPSKTSLQWPSRRPFPRNLLPMRTAAEEPYTPYTCDFNVPVIFNIVKDSPLDKIELISDPDLDRDMQNAITPLPSGETQTLFTRAGAFVLTGLVDIQCSALPAHISFRAVFRDENGTEHALTNPAQAIFARAGASERLNLYGKQADSRTLMAEQMRRRGQPAIPMLPARNKWRADMSDSALKPGTHKGTIILRPDPNGLYPDPTIKAIWGGTLEFPVTITVTQKK